MFIRNLCVYFTIIQSRTCWHFSVPTTQINYGSCLIIFASYIEYRTGEPLQRKQPTHISLHSIRLHQRPSWCGWTELLDSRSQLATRGNGATVPHGFVAPMDHFSMGLLSGPRVIPLGLKNRHFWCSWGSKGTLRGNNKHLKKQIKALE